MVLPVIWTGVREFFTDISESYLDLDIELGNDSKVKAVGRGTVSFQRESKQPMKVKDLLYVPGLTNNLSKFQPARAAPLGGMDTLDTSATALGWAQ